MICNPVGCHICTNMVRAPCTAWSVRTFPVVYNSSLPHHVFGRFVILVARQSYPAFVLPSAICQSPLTWAYGAEYFPLISSGVGCSLQRSLRYRWPRGTTYVLVVWCDDRKGETGLEGALGTEKGKAREGEGKQ